MVLLSLGSTPSGAVAVVSPSLSQRLSHFLQRAPDGKRPFADAAKKPDRNTSAPREGEEDLLPADTKAWLLSPYHVSPAQETSPYAEALKLRSYSKAQPKFNPLCILNTGRSCTPANRAGNSEDDLMEYMNECRPGIEEGCQSWKVDDLWVGYCVCSPGYCANSEGECVDGGGMRVPQEGGFEITTKKFGRSAPLYMAADGTVRVAAGAGHKIPAYGDRWEVIVQSDGTLQFYTQAYPTRLLDLYNRCITMATGQVRCEQAVGHHEAPFPTEVAWRLDKSGKIAPNGNQYLMLREVHAESYLFASPISYEALGCMVNSRNCPGDEGLLWFNPPIVTHMEVPLTEPPQPKVWTFLYYFGLSLAFLLFCCIMVLNVRYDQKHNRFF